jgi:hypothetical protein
MDGPENIGLMGPHNTIVLRGPHLHTAHLPKRGGSSRAKPHIVHTHTRGGSFSQKIESAKLRGLTLGISYCYVESAVS